jgi:uracil-DNA glycosylase family 4
MMGGMSKKIALKIRNKSCQDCKLHAGAEDVCVVGKGNHKASIVVVGKMPNSGSYQHNLELDLKEAGLDVSDMYFTSATKCRNFELDATQTDVKACRKYLEQEIALVKPDWVLTMGNEALQSVLGHSGIMKWRGKTEKKGSYSVFPTISPSSVNRNPGQRQGYLADLKLFVAEVQGKPDTITVPKIEVVNTEQKLVALRRRLLRAELLSYDVETRSDPQGCEWARNARIVSLSGTMIVDGEVEVWALPLSHPESVWKSKWKSVLKFLADGLMAPTRKIAQNAKYDDRWLTEFGVDMLHTFDTMLAAHLIDENLSKGLKPQAMMRLGVRPWAIDTTDLWKTPIKDVLRYNALDTFYTYHLYLELKELLSHEPRLARIFLKIMMPASQRLKTVERRGVWVDRERLSTNTKIAYDMRAEIDKKLMEYVPWGNDEQLEYIGWPRMGKRAKFTEVNFNPSNFARWWLFDHLKFPIIKMGKTGPSMAEDVMLELRLNHPHPVVDLLLERAKWQKFCSSFLESYEALLDPDDRIHTSFKLYGTVTGRLSSGKTDAEKITARAPIRGVNLQQVPRDPFIRGLFGSAPGYTFVEADFSQVELRVVAHLSRDRTMRTLYNTGQDIHRATAAWVLGKPPAEVTKDDRKKAKAVNFGFVYGMGAPKFVRTAFEKYDVVFTLEEAKDVRKVFFEMYSGLLPWHNRQRRLVHEYRRVQSPLGRVRHLPDISSQDSYVRGEAERQAINSPVQSFASDMTMLSMVLIQRKFDEMNVDAHFISTVHDSLLFEIRDKDVARCLPVIKDTMEDLPLKKMFGVVLEVPIVSDLKVGRYWGDAIELTPEQVYDFGR